MVRLSPESDFLRSRDSGAPPDFIQRVSLSPPILIMIIVIMVTILVIVIIVIIVIIVTIVIIVVQLLCRTRSQTCPCGFVSSDAYMIVAIYNM